ncbi:MAG TPA: DUF1284 domain-containing protein, partial [bacterium]|nr:DUF1284 domain-containing protein [bacterium]
MMKTVLLRPHHLLCILNFKGFGYSRDFVRNMAIIVKSVQKSPDTGIRLTSGEDAICRKCPLATSKKCRRDSDGTVTQMDRELAQLLKIPYNKTYPAGVVFSLLRRTLDECKLEKICSRCHWYPSGMCKDGLQRL